VGPRLLSALWRSPGAAFLLCAATIAFGTVTAASARPQFRAPFRSYPAIAGARSLAVADFNGDGAIDVAVASRGIALVCILLNDGTGEFLPASFVYPPDYSFAVTAGDLNGDGHPDLVVGGTYGNIVSVFIGRGDGSFLASTPYGTGPDPHSIAIGDVNQDGKPDLVVANSNEFYGRSISVLLGNGDGTFQPRIDSPMDGVSASSISLADFDHDGRLDLVAGYDGGATFVYVMRGLGDGRFGPIEGYDSAYGPDVMDTGDLNHDGNPDFVAGGTYDGAVSVHLGKGDGTFQAKREYPVPGAGSSVSLTDIDLDGNLDVLTPMAFMRGRGDGTFAAPVTFVSEFQPSSAAAADVDGDGIIDLLTADPTPGTVSVLHGVGGGHFDQMLLPTFGRPDGIAGGDLDGDATLDLAVASTDGSLTLFMGDGNGGFPRRTQLEGSASQAVALADLDHNGTLDLVTIYYGTVSTRLGDGAGGFAAAVADSARLGADALATGDLDEDGRMDVVTTSPGWWDYSIGRFGAFRIDSTATILFGAGDGTFARRADVTTGQLPRAVVVADLNRDGHQDLLVVNSSSSTTSALLGNGDGTFRPRIDVATGPHPVAMGLGDFNEDGVPDFATADTWANSILVFLGNGDGTFRTLGGFSPYGTPEWIGVGDWNGDGHADLAVTVDNSNTVRLWMGNGDGSFIRAGYYGAAEGPVHGIVADLNHDGRPDIVVANHDAATITPLLNADGDLTTPTLLSLVGCEVAAHRVLLRWLGSLPSGRALVERRSFGDPWTEIGEPHEEQGLLVFDDEQVRPGERYAYRLRVGTALTEETWVDVPSVVRLELSSDFRAGSAMVTLTSTEPAYLDVFDIAGRRTLHRKLEHLAAGEQRVPVPEAASWMSGAYFARLSQGAHTARAKWRLLR